MSRIVTDTSVILAVIANEPERPALIRATRNLSLLAPTSVHWEIGNALSAMLKRKRITLAQGEKLIRAYAQIPIQFVDVDLVESLSFTDIANLYAYDAYVLQCARMHRVPVISLDKRLINAATRLKIDIVEVS